MKNIVTLGGASGHTQVLLALKDMPGIRITAITPSTDSGGSTGILKDSYGASGYLGDLTKCIVALSRNEKLARALMYRYEDGPIAGHSVKNLLFFALEKTGSLASALRTMGAIADIDGHRVLPVTSKKTELRARLALGSVIAGETNIDNIAKNPLWNPNVHSIKDVYLAPSVPASSDVIAALETADLIILSPGDLYSSIVPTLLPKGVSAAVRKSKAPVVLFLNIMTKQGETDHYTAEDFIRNIEKYLGKRVDHIVANSAKIPKKALLRYSLESKVELGKFVKKSDARVITAPVAMTDERGALVSDPKTIRKVVERILR
ncbi:MAG: YvcK family protein [Patescibacteria group bacterium]|nr:YvcK family protein [Patescibacteria group bacterium]MDE1945613.1 YvcK family protein [Patescibacteria group bacterium]